ncbi:MAG: hypothetical protein ACTSUE_10595 [Promethearchaeota archaeon]
MENEVAGRRRRGIGKRRRRTQRRRENEEPMGRRKRKRKRLTGAAVVALANSSTTTLSMMRREGGANHLHMGNRFNSYHRLFMKSCTMRYAAHVFDDSQYQKHLKQNPTLDGDEVVRKIITTLTSLRYIFLYPFQLDTLKLILPTIYPYIYRKSWNEHQSMILKNHKMSKIYEEVFFRAPRRFGKTLTLAIYCLAVLVNVQKDRERPFHIAVFAITSDASKRFIEECAIQWAQIDRRNDYEFYRTAEKIMIIKKSDSSDRRVISSFCGSGGVRSPFFCFFF